ncbi:MAG TPA: fluoride efflux transporter CrcB [Solirubrobacteraceae bacterium]
MIWVSVALLGGAGAVARFLVDTFVERRAGGLFPWGTLVVNLTGSFALGLLTGVALHGHVEALLGGALLGSYTTFSTWMLETAWLGDSGNPALGIANLVGSLAAGLAAAGAGWALGAVL